MSNELFSPGLDGDYIRSHRLLQLLNTGKYASGWLLGMLSTRDHTGIITGLWDLYRNSCEDLAFEVMKSPKFVENGSKPNYFGIIKKTRGLVRLGNGNEHMTYYRNDVPEDYLVLAVEGCYSVEKKMYDRARIVVYADVGEGRYEEVALDEEDDMVVSVMNVLLATVRRSFLQYCNRYETPGEDY